jgi:hypothetical protein
MKQRTFKRVYRTFQIGLTFTAVPVFLLIITNKIKI